MKKHITRSGLAALAAAAFLTGCDPEIDAPEISKGDADFTRYVSVGNSLTSGYADGGLYRSGQINSYPNILAGQFKLAGGGDFPQPLFPEDKANGSGYLRLAGFNADGTPKIATVTDNLAIRGVNSKGTPLYIEYTGPVQNLGVPDIRIADIKTAGYGSTAGNPYFERITPDNNQNQTYLERVEASNPTFFTNWLGNNDVLGYATAGGMTGTASITDEATFRTNYEDLTKALTKSGAKGVVATIPDVTLIPFFTTVGPTLKATLAAKGLPGMIILTGSGNTKIPLPTTSIKDASGGTVLVPLTASAYLPLLGLPTAKYWRDLLKRQQLPALALPVLLAQYGVTDTTKAFGFSMENPLPSSLILDNSEIANVTAATDKFNSIIKETASNNNLGVFDVNPFFTSILPVNGQPALVINAVNYTPAFISGNIFSLDGVHLTPRGYALVANEFIKTINAKYNAKLPTVNVNAYNAVLFP
ncbi:SGNH/GDSL hydrolase family protein [Adhaeribacter terreus]|uniref:SGNH/GDSL hydrolase family protein n=1 Tax=Adhaeribacter terreus TaxID=529703 RepID=A0ABW0ECU2_9BACT